MSVTLTLLRLAALRPLKWRLRTYREHLRILADQRDSAIAGIAIYEARADKLEREIALLESPGTIVRRAAA